MSVRRGEWFRLEGWVETGLNQDLPDVSISQVGEVGRSARAQAKKDGQGV